MVLHMFSSIPWNGILPKVISLRVQSVLAKGFQTLGLWLEGIKKGSSGDLLGFFFIISACLRPQQTWYQGILAVFSFIHFCYFSYGIILAGATFYDKSNMNTWKLEWKLLAVSICFQQSGFGFWSFFPTLSIEIYSYLILVGWGWSDKLLFLMFDEIYRLICMESVLGMPSFFLLRQTETKSKACIVRPLIFVYVADPYTCSSSNQSIFFKSKSAKPHTDYFMGEINGELLMGNWIHIQLAFPCFGDTLYSVSIWHIHSSMQDKVKTDKGLATYNTELL